MMLRLLLGAFLFHLLLEHVRHLGVTAFFWSGVMAAYSPRCRAVCVSPGDAFSHFK
jgi:hypothetical protein